MSYCQGCADRQRQVEVEVAKREQAEAEWDAAFARIWKQLEAAEAEVARLRGALRSIEGQTEGFTLATLKARLFDRLRDVRRIARAALAEGGRE